MGHITFTILLESICCWALCPSNIFKHIDPRWRIQDKWIFDNEEIVDTWRKVSTCRTLSETACNFPLSMGKTSEHHLFFCKICWPFSWCLFYYPRTWTRERRCMISTLMRRIQTMASLWVPGPCSMRPRMVAIVGCPGLLQIWAKVKISVTLPNTYIPF